jgi:hypothetical protein
MQKKNGKRGSMCKIIKTKKIINNQSKRYLISKLPKLIYINKIQMKENVPDMKDQQFEFMNDEKEKEDTQALVWICLVGKNADANKSKIGCCHRRTTARCRYDRCRGKRRCGRPPGDDSPWRRPA